jgi:hypothetical protein
MDTLVTWVFRSVLISGLMLVYYYAALRDRKMHSFNRVFLLMALVASVVLPFVRLPWLRWQTRGEQVNRWLVLAGPKPEQRGMSLPEIAGLLCGAVSAVLLLVLLWRIVAVWRLRMRHGRHRMQGCYLIEVKDPRAPFSFLDNLFWQQGADLGDPVHRRIFDHELAHIRGRHTYDNLFAQALAAVVWMNPFYWAIRRELMMVHEFIADDASIKAGDTEMFARMLLQAYDDGRYLDPTHRFFHSPIKRRLTMISKNKRPSGYRKWLALPAVLAVMALSCSKEQSAAEKKGPLAPPAIEKVLAFKQVQWKLRLDSVRIQYKGQQDKKMMVYLVGQNAGKDTFRVSEDPLSQKRQLDLIEVEGIPKTGNEPGDPIRQNP